MKLDATQTYSTNDYSVFHYATGNRVVNEAHIKEIIKSIQKYGLMPTTIIVNERMEVIDGQHRLEALKRLHLPVHYQIHRGLRIKECIAMNSTSKKWNYRDYIHSYASMGNPHYQKVERLMTAFPKLSLVAIATTLANKAWGSVSNKTLINGEFKAVVSENNAREKLNIIQEVLRNTERVGGRKELLVIALVRLLELGVLEKDRLIEQTKNYACVFSGFIDLNGTIEQIEEVYNYRKKSKVRFVSTYKAEYIDKGGQDNA